MKRVRDELGRVLRVLFAGGALAGVLAYAAPLRAQVAAADVGSSLFLEPSKTSKLIVVNPSAGLAVMPTRWLTLNGQYQADIVSGASEPAKSGRVSKVDTVTQATHFSDTRHQLTGGFTITRETTHLGASFSYGTEHDYRSKSFAVNAGTDFLQKNTQLELSYGRGFDEVCTTNYLPTDETTARVALDSSDG